jgi:hypothetical protein
MIALMMEAVSTTERSVNIYHTTGRNIPEDAILVLVLIFLYAPHMWSLRFKFSG